MDGEPVRPAPKPSQRSKQAKSAKRAPAKSTPAKRAPAKKAAPPAENDVKEGTVTYTDAFLLANEKTRKKLLDSPDGTPGKDVAMRVEVSIPIILQASEEVKAWKELHGKETHHLRKLAEHLVKLRTFYEDKKGRPDMRGTSSAYRDAAALIYKHAGIPPAATSTIQGAVRHHVSTVLREVLLHDFANGDEQKYLALCKDYRINPKSPVERKRDQRRGIAGTRLPAVVVPDDDVIAAWHTSVNYAHRALEAPGVADPSALPEEERETLREELEAVQERITELLEALEE